MDDNGIVQLYWQRSENAIVETDKKYGGYCYHIAYNILTNREDAQECVSDTYLAAWHAMPPQRPGILSAFLGKITRNLSIDRWRKAGAQKRGSGEIQVALEELGDCVSGSDTVEERFDRRELSRSVNTFLAGLKDTERNVFLCRYWYLDSVKEIAAFFGFSESKVASMLLRLRRRLRAHLEKEGHL